MEPSRHAHQSSEETLRILVVDDEPMLRQVFYKILENGGYDVLSASSGAEALAICRRSSPPIDLLITDYNMPEMDGVELARECSAMHPALPVLYVSGGNHDPRLYSDLQKPRRAFLEKPFRGDALLRKTKELLLQHSNAACSL
jgi:CheY-like chemotaxis protein